MNADLQRFSMDLASNEALRTAVKAAGTDRASIVKAANEKGYKFTLADVDEVTASGELSDAQLKGVAGGAVRVMVWKGSDGWPDAFIEWT